MLLSLDLRGFGSPNAYTNLIASLCLRAPESAKQREPQSESICFKSALGCMGLEGACLSSSLSCLSSHLQMKSSCLEEGFHYRCPPGT